MSYKVALVSLEEMLSGKSKGKQIMLIGITLLVLSNFLGQPISTEFCAPSVLLWLGLFTFINGFAIYVSAEEHNLGVHDKPKRNEIKKSRNGRKTQKSKSD